MQTLFTNKRPPLLQPKENRPSFLYVGRLSEEKGLDLIFKAFEIQKFELVIIGDGPLKRQVELFVSKNPEVQYLGFQNKETIKKIMKTSTALLFCSKCFEGMPMTILEAFSNGTPVIASALGCIPDIVTNGFNGLLFNNDDEYDLSGKIQQWSKMPALKKEVYRENSMQTFQDKFSADINFDQLLSIYNNLLK